MMRNKLIVLFLLQVLSNANIFAQYVKIDSTLAKKIEGSWINAEYAKMIWSMKSPTQARNSTDGIFLLGCFATSDRDMCQFERAAEVGFYYVGYIIELPTSLMIFDDTRGRAVISILDDENIMLTAHHYYKWKMISSRLTRSEYLYKNIDFLFIGDWKVKNMANNEIYSANFLDIYKTRSSKNYPLFDRDIKNISNFSSFTQYEIVGQDIYFSFDNIDEICFPISEKISNKINSQNLDVIILYDETVCCEKCFYYKHFGTKIELYDIETDELKFVFEKN